MIIKCSHCGGVGTSPSSGISCHVCGGSGNVTAKGTNIICEVHSVASYEKTLILEGKLVEMEDKLNDILDKCNDIFEKVSE